VNNGADDPKDSDMDNLYFSTTGPHQYRVFYRPGMDGGGTWFGQEYATVLSTLYPNRQFRNCLEWCAGPAFIGYNILDHGLCKHLTLIEIHDETAAQSERSRSDSHNKCVDQVTIYNSGTISDIPAEKQFDLIVGNPPHFPHASVDPDVSRIESDDGWRVHRDFFANVKPRLAPDGVILLQENMIGSTVETFEKCIQHAGLQVRQWFRSPKWFKYPEDNCQIYYIEIVHV
jgi:methylase of polypeptide subunit release factors